MKNLHRSTRRRSLWATAIAAIVAIAACKKNDDKQAAQLAITSFSPAEAAEGATVVIKGIAFSPDKALNTVKFNGLAAAVSNAAANGTQLSVTVPEDATTGKITVTVGDQTVTSATEFKVNATAPVITAIAPLKGDIGAEVTITGNRFANTSEVYFGGVKASEVTFVSKTSLKVKLPAGALNGKVKVIAASLEALSPADFWVKPTITGFTAEKAPEGTVIEINGTNFSTVKAENSVYFGTVEAKDITEATPTKLKVKVPVDAVNEKIKVVVQEQEAETATKFTLLPTLTAFSPASIERGKPLTITGKNFNSGEIWLNGKRLASYVSGGTTIGLIIPNDAESGKLVIKQSGVDQEFATELRVVNYWRIHDNRVGPISYGQSRSFVYNKKIYRALGYTEGGGLTPQVHSYDPLTKTWNHEFDIPAKVPLRRSHFSTINGTKWYFGGGDIGGSASRDNCWVMDLTQTGDAAFTQLTNLTAPSISDGAFVLSGEVYVVAQTYGNKIYKLNPGANGGKGSWTPVIDIAMQGGSVSNLFTLGNIGYIKSNAGVMYEFDPTGTSPKFTTKATVLKNIAWDPTLFGLNGKGYYITSDGMDEFDPVANTWTPKSRYIGPSDMEVHTINGRVWGIAYAGQVYEYIYQ